MKLETDKRGIVPKHDEIIRSDDAEEYGEVETTKFDRFYPFHETKQTALAHTFPLF